MKVRRFTLTVFVLIMGLLMPLLISRMATATAIVQVAPLAEAFDQVASTQANSPVGGPHETRPNVTGAYIVYSNDATSIYVVPRQAGTMPDLDLLSAGQLITASPSCNPTGRPSLITLSDGYGDFLAIWTEDASTKCYSRFVHNADGTFSESNQGAWPADWSVSDSPADLNGDGWDDLLLIRRVSPSGNSYYEYKVALGQSGSRFDFNATPITIVQNVWGAHFTLGEANGDGKHDLVYHSLASGGAFTTEIYMLAGNGNGTFANVASRQLVVSAPTNVSSGTPVFGDFNENGRADLFLPPDDDTNDMGQAYIALYNDNESSFTVQPSIDWRTDVEYRVPDWFGASAQSCDVNLDGHLDLIARTNDIRARTYSYSVHVGDGGGKLEENGSVIDSGSNPGISLACSRASTLNMSKTVSSPTAQPNETLTYELVLTATGEAADVVLSDTLPAGLIYVANSLTGGASYDNVTHQINYTGPVSPSTPHVISYQATIDSQAAPGSMFNNGVLVEWDGKFREDAATVVIPDRSFNDTLVLIYANADNDLSQHMLDLVHRAEQAAGNGHVRVLLLLDGPNEKDAYLYHLQKTAGCISYGPPPAGSPPAACPYQLLQNVWQWDENMATVVSLSEFLIGAENAYPNANKTVLSIVGHGYGWMAPIVELIPGPVSVRSSIRTPDLLSAPTGGGHGAQPGGFLWDNHPRRSLSTTELGQALNKFTQATGEKIDLLYLDACTMGMEEVAYEFRNSVHYLLASENTAWTSFRYKKMIKAITSSMSPIEIGKKWLNIEADDLEGDDYPFTLSLTELNPIETWRTAQGDPVPMEKLRIAQDELADALIDALNANRSLNKDKIDAAFTDSACFDSNGDHYIIRALNQTTVDNDPLSVDSYCDLHSFAAELRTEFGSSSAVGQAANKVKNNMPRIFKRKNNGIPWIQRKTKWHWKNLGGLSVYLPLIQDEWRRGYYNSSSLQFAGDSQWDEFLAEYWNHAAPPKWEDSPDCCLQAPLGQQRVAAIPLRISEGLDSHTLNWTPPAGLINSATYQLSRTADLGVTYTPITSTSDTLYNDTDPILQSGAEYCYEVTDGVNRSNIVCSHGQESGITNVTPRYGLNSVSSAIYIYGNGFTDTLTVTLGTQPLQVNFVRLDDEPQRIRAVVPEGLTPDLYDITVETPTDAFTVTDAYNVIEATEVDDLLSNREWLWTDPFPMRVGFTQSSVGLNVQHLGGTTTMDSVTVEFRLDGTNGQLLGRSLTNLLAPDAIEATGPVTWEPQEPSNPDDDPIEYTVCAIIDPDNQVVESDETNNVICQTVDVLPPHCLPNHPDYSCEAVDTEPPEVDSFVIADDAPSTLNPDATLDMQATDYPNPGGSGMGTMKFLEFEYILGARRWVAVKQSNWEAYDTVRQDHPWALEETFGMRYMQTWAADNAGNISLKPGVDVIDLLPTEQADTVGPNGIIFYRILLDEGDPFTATMTPESGDPDMFVWYPDGTIKYDPDLSGIEQVGFTAPMKGTYQIEIHAPASGSASYRLAFDATRAAEKRAPEAFDRRRQDIPEEPAVPLDEWPEYYELDLPPIVETTEPTDYTVYLPISIR